MSIRTDWISGEILTAEDLNDNFSRGVGLPFKFFILNLAQAKYNGTLDIEYTEGLQGNSEIHFDSLETSAGYDSGESSSKVHYEATPGILFVASTFDLFDDESLDSTLWTGSTDGGGDAAVTELAVGSVLVDGGTSNSYHAFLTSDGASGFDAKNGGTFIFAAWWTQGTGGAQGEHAFRVTNGTTAVTIFQNSDFLSGFYEIYFDDVVDEAYWRRKTSATTAWSSWSAGVDISSVTTNWYAQFYCEGDGGIPGEVGIDTTYYVQGPVSSQDVVFATYNADTTINNAIFSPIYHDKGGESTCTFHVSRNVGSNYTTVTQDSYADITSTTGSQLKCKMTVTTGGSRPVWITEYGTYIGY